MVSFMALLHFSVETVCVLSKEGHKHYTVNIACREAIVYVGKKEGRLARLRLRRHTEKVNWTMHAPSAQPPALCWDLSEVAEWGFSFRFTFCLFACSIVEKDSANGTISILLLLFVHLDHTDGIHWFPSVLSFCMFFQYKNEQRKALSHVNRSDACFATHVLLYIV